MAATVTGTFRLIDQASGPLRDIERQAQKTDRALASMGDTIDSIGTKDQLDQLSDIGAKLRQNERQAKQSSGEMDTLSQSTNTLGNTAERTGRRMTRFTRVLLLLGGALAALLPIVIDLSGALGALIGSLGAAIKGVGALAVGLGGALVVGLAGVAASALSASERLKNLKGEFDDFKETWKGLTERGSNDFMAMIRDSMADVEKLMPMLAKSVNRTMPAARDAMDQFFNRLNSPQFERFVERMTTSFERIAGPIMQTIANIGQTLGNIAVAVAPFVEEMMRGFADITRGWAGQTNNIEDLRASLDKAVDQAKSWLDLLGATWDLTKAVFGSGADEGQGLVDDMTKKLREYEKWITSNPEKMDNFWKDSIQGTKELAKFLGSLRLPLKNLNDAMEPLVRFFERLTGALARLELPFTNISGLTALLAAIGGVKAYRGIQGMLGARGSTPANPLYVRDVMATRSTAGRGGGGAVATGGGGGRGGRGSGDGSGGGRGGRGGRLGGLGGLLGKAGKVLPWLGAGLFANELFSTGDGQHWSERVLDAGNIIDPTTIPAMLFDPDNPDGLFKRFGEAIGGGEGLPSAGDLFGGFDTSGRQREARRNRRRMMRRARAGQYTGDSLPNAHAPGSAGALLDLPTPAEIQANSERVQAQGGGPMSHTPFGRAIQLPEMNTQKLKKSMDAIEGRATRLNKTVKDDTSDKWHKTRRSMVEQMEKSLPELRTAMAKIRSMTVAELQGMGYTATEAQDMMNFSNGGGGRGRGDGQPAGGRNRRPGNNAYGGRLDGFAGGGRIRGHGKRDTVPVTMGMAAPGELIVNRHTEGRVNSMLGMFGTNLGKEVGNENVPHSGTPRPGHGPGKPHVFHAKGGRFARGGRTPMNFAYPDAMGALPGLDALAYYLKQKFGLSVTSGLRPGAITSSGNPSDHGWGGAIDVSNGVTTPQMDAAHAWLQANFSGAIKQMLYRTMVGGNHYDHIHVALNEAYARNPQAVARLADGGGPAVGGMTMGPAQQIRLNAPRTRLRGAPGMAAQAGINAVTRGMERGVNRRLRGGGRGGRGATVRGKATYFGGGMMASGLNTDVNPGIALNPNPGGPDPGSWDNPTTQRWLENRQRFMVRVGGKSAILPMLDKGPAGWTGNAIDVNMAGLAKMGFTTGNFPSGTVGTATAMARGGRLPGFAGWYGNGGKFTANRPTLVGVGEAGAEQVTVTPANKGTAGRGGGSRGVQIGSINIQNNRKGDIRKQVKEELQQAFAELEREIQSDTGNGIV